MSLLSILQTVAPNSFLNYKFYYSVILFVIVSGNYEYLYANGGVSDSGVMQEKGFY